MFVRLTQFSKIGGRAFYGCDNLLAITIPDKVTSIDDHAFYSCDNLTSATLGNGVIFLGDSVFSNCISLTSIVFNGPSPPSIGGAVFDNIHPTASVSVWPEHAASFIGEEPVWNGLPVSIRFNTPNDIVAELTSISFDGTTATISIIGGPSTVYRCHHSPDLESFTTIPTTPVTVRTNASGEATFTVELTDHKGFFTFIQPSN